MEPQSNLVKKIAIDLIDEPAEAARTFMDKQALDDLVESIRANGLIQPIVVKPKGDRFEVVVGHRRYRAHRILEAVEIECIVKNYNDEQAESTKLHENLFREEVNPVDEAMFLSRYIKRTGSQLAEVAKMLHRSEEWVTGRVEILNYPDYLIGEVHRGKIPLGVARALAQIEDETTRKEYTRFAALTGINITTARRWLASSKTGNLPSNPAHLEVGMDYITTPSSAFVAKCVICGETDEMTKMENDLLHPTCRRDLALFVAAEKRKEPVGVEGAKPPV